MLAWGDQSIPEPFDEISNIESIACENEYSCENNTKEEEVEPIKHHNDNIRRNFV
jgi:hypothetical protein